MWTGAASFIELGLAVPKNGGVQEYLRSCYSEFLGFLFSWVYIAIGKPCAIAVTAMIFAENLSVAVFSEGTTAPWLMKVIAIAGLWLITFINCLGRIAGAQAANLFLLFKLLAISSIAVVGIMAGSIRQTREGAAESNFQWFGADPDVNRRTMPTWTQVGEYITAIYGALYCYGGWESVSDILQEVRLPLCVLMYDHWTRLGSLLATWLIHAETYLESLIPQWALLSAPSV